MPDTAPPRNPHQKRPLILVIGAGFGGAYCAKNLKGAINHFDADVLVIDRNNYFIFYPLLVEAGTGSLEPRHAIVPVRQFLQRSSRFRMGEFVSLNLESQVVTYRMVGEEETKEIQYDHLVLAIGSVTRLPPIPGLKQYGYEMKSIADSVALRDRAIQMLELANTVSDAEKKRALLHFVVVGSNFTGIEVAGEFQEFLRDASRIYRNITPSDCQISIVERGDRILGVLDKDLADFAAENLKKRGVKIHVKTSIKELLPDRVILDNGEVLASHTLVWCGGIKQNPLAEKLPIPLDERGYIQCERDLRVKGFQNIWAIGDCASIPDEHGNPYPATAQHATRQGKLAARNIERSLRGDDTKPCDLANMGSLAALGCRTAVAKVFGIKVSGFVAWWLWRTVYLMKMPTLSRKMRVAFDWTIDLFFQRDYGQLGIHRKAAPPIEKSS